MACSSDPADPGAVRGFQPPCTEEEALLLRRAEELCTLAVRRGVPRHTGFLSEREQVLAQAGANRAACHCIRFWGGWPGAERRVLCVEPPDAWQEEPVAVVRILLPAAGGNARPGHRDLLGAILGLGLERAAVGDIRLPPEGESDAYALVLADKADFIAANLTMAGPCAVRTEVCGGLPAARMQDPPRTICQATVASLRADAVLGAMLRIPRAQAAQAIAAGRVLVNHVPLRAAHERVYAQDLFTISDVGRCRLQAIGGKSRKDRIFIEFYRY